jgi:hypothetical protein
MARKFDTETKARVMRLVTDCKATGWVTESCDAVTLMLGISKEITRWWYRHGWSIAANEAVSPARS